MTLQGKKKPGNALIYTIAIAVIVAALVFCIIMISSINRRMNESAISNLLNTTHVITDTLDSQIQRDYEALRIVGALYEDGVIVTPDQLTTLRTTMGFDWLGLADSQGNGGDLFENHFSLDQYPETKEWNLRETGHSDAYIGRTSGRAQITMWTPIFNEEEYLGAVLGNVLLTNYYSANIFTFYEGAGRTYLFNSVNGNWIIKSRGTDGTLNRNEDIYSLLNASGNNADDLAAFESAVNAGQQGAAMLNFNNEMSFLCFMPMPNSPNWYVATVISKDALLKESSEINLIIKLVLSVLCLTLLFAALSLMLWRLKRARTQEAHYREALFANVSANIDSAFIIHENADDKPVYVSDNITRLMGMDRERISCDAGALFDWCGIPKDAPQRLAFLGGTLKKPVVQEVTIQNELGEKARTIRLELIPADLGQTLAVLTDITHDKEIQQSMLNMVEQAKVANNAKNDFISAMSHDLRTPLNGIMGMAAIADAHLNDPKRVHDCLSKISNSGTQLLALVNEVLDMSQIESGKIELNLEPFNLAELLQNVLNVNYPGIEQKNHTVHVQIPFMAHEEVIGDPVRLTRIATNLISNAIKYTPKHGCITLALREKEAMMPGFGCYELTVRDNGIGMSEEFLPKLFEPFEREKDVRMQRIQGTGLGLSIVKNFVDLMMGSIQVESEKGKGTTFRVTLNLKLNEQQTQVNARLDRLKVLVADSDAATASAICDILRSIGMMGEWTTSGAQALDMVVRQHQQNHDYFAMVLDWKLPDVSGQELARSIRDKTGAKRPIIIFSAYNWNAALMDGNGVNVDHFLSKPIYKAKLLQKMTEFVSSDAPAKAWDPALTAVDIPKGKRILVVEDNPLNREISMEILQSLGIRTDCVEDGAAAVKAFTLSAEGTYDLILMDIQMPNMNGYEATRAIRASCHKQARTIPIVAMTADAYEKDKLLAFKAGMNEHLAKPISLQELTQVLHRFLSRPIV